jgi:hypothetical protein
VAGGWRKLHNELRDLYSLQSTITITIITMIKSRRMRWAVHVARMGKKENTYRWLVWKARGKEINRKAKTKVDGSWRDRLGWCGLG